MFNELFEQTNKVNEEWEPVDTLQDLEWGSIQSDLEKTGPSGIRMFKPVEKEDWDEIYNKLEELYGKPLGPNREGSFLFGLPEGYQAELTRYWPKGVLGKRVVSVIIRKQRKLRGGWASMKKEADKVE